MAGMITTQFRLSLLSILVVLLLPACSRSGGSGLTARETQAFDKASPELKQSWTAALAAAKTNDYVGAQTLLYGLLGQQLTPEQQQAVQDEITVVKDNLTAAVQKGDPAAQAALQQLRQNPPNRARH
jgi:hypothetical protein